MVDQPKALVHETSSTTGTGDFTLSNVNGKQSFNDAHGTGGTDKFAYYISNRDAAEWEYGTGHLSASSTLVRDTVIASSNSNAAVNFSAGTKDVTNDVGADRVVEADTTQTLTNKTLTSPTINSPALGAGSVDAITEIASGIKSGSDTTLVTGTAGTANNVIIWNADGDAVDGGSSVADLQQTDEEIQDVVGAMVTGNTETNITVTYQDADGTIDFEVPSASTSAEGVVERATTAEVRDPSTDGKFPTVKDLYDAAAEVTLTDAATISVDLDTGIDFTVTLGGNRTLGSPTNVTVGKRGRIRVVQDGTGSRTLAYGSNYEFSGGTAPTLSTGANDEDFLDYDCVSATRIRLAFSEDWS